MIFHSCVAMAEYTAEFDFIVTVTQTGQILGQIGSMPGPENRDG